MMTRSSLRVNFNIKGVDFISTPFFIFLWNNLQIINYFPYICKVYWCGVVWCIVEGVEMLRKSLKLDEIGVQLDKG